MITEKNILENIIAIRKQKGYSQDFVASQIGLAQPGYALIEKGNRGLDISRLLQIAIVLDVDVIELLQGPNKSHLKEMDEERVSITFEVPASQRDHLLELVTKQKK